MFIPQMLERESPGSQAGVLITSGKSTPRHRKAQKYRLLARPKGKGWKVVRLLPVW